MPEAVALISGLVLIVSGRGRARLRSSGEERAHASFYFLLFGALSAAAVPSIGFYLTMSAAFGACVAGLLAGRSGGLANLGSTSGRLAVLAALLPLSVGVREAFGAGNLDQTVRPMVAALLTLLLLMATKVVASAGPYGFQLLVRTAVVGSISIGLVVESATRPCRSDKCSFVGALYRGPFPSENTFAILAIAFLVACVASPVRGRFLAADVIAGFALVAATGSRGAVVAGLLTLIVAFGLSRIADGDSADFQVARIVAWSYSIALSGASVWLLAASSRATLTRRGRFWLAIRDEEGLLSFFGSGPTGWTTIQSSIETASFPHSQFALTYVLGGYLALGILTASIAVSTRMIRGLTKKGLSRALPPAVLLPIYCLSETIWNPVAVDGLIWLVIATYAYSSSFASIGVPPNSETRLVVGLQARTEAQESRLGL